MAPLAPWLHLWLQEKNEKERTVLTWCLIFQSQKARNNATLTKTAELRWKATLSVLDATFVVVKKFPANKDCLLKLCMVVKSASTIGVGAGKFLVVRRNFARILTTFPKKSNKSDRQKKEESSSCQFGRHFLQVKACWAPFLLKFSGSLWRFSEILPGFCGILPGFYGILPGFSPNQNFWGCGCTPASYTSGFNSFLRVLLGKTCLHWAHLVVSWGCCDNTFLCKLVFMLFTISL